MPGDYAYHGGMAWDYDKEGRVYPKSVAACEWEDIQQARQRAQHRGEDGQKGASK